MRRIILIILAVAIASAGLAWLIVKNNNEPISDPDLINEASEASGNIPEKVIGDPSTATVTVFEYADYACGHCAAWNTSLSKLIEEGDGKVAVVFRSYNLGLSKNGLTVAKAATAAQLQGYFNEYKDLLFKNQAEWYYASKDKLNELLVQYFEQASSGKGDTDKFKSDLTSEAVAKRVDYENKMGKKIGLKGTPLFRIDGKDVEISSVLEVIKEKIAIQ